MYIYLINSVFFTIYLHNHDFSSELVFTAAEKKSVLYPSVYQFRVSD